MVRKSRGYPSTVSPRCCWCCWLYDPIFIKIRVTVSTCIVLHVMYSVNMCQPLYSCYLDPQALSHDSPIGAIGLYPMSLVGFDRVNIHE